MSSIIDFLTSRRSVSAVLLGPPGPDSSQLNQIITAGIRVPDHGKLAPWRFILFDGERRRQAGESLLRLRLQRGEQLSAEEKDAELNRFTRAPIVIGLVSRAAPHVKIPEWEQILSAGAVGMNLLNGAHALGFAAQWLTDWPVYDVPAGRLLGLAAEERFAGFIHVGTQTTVSRARRRPTPEEVLTRWAPPKGHG